MGFGAKTYKQATPTGFGTAGYPLQ